ncbi:MAG: hypothetical protein M3N32_00860, partial [Actinomycetota bacterium]|nr:hypothetical protein [Actinomycetota bacterium]
MDALDILNTARIVVGLIVLGLTMYFATRRVGFLYGLLKKAQPDPGRGTWGYVRRNSRYLLSKVFGQEKLLRWSLPGVMHAWVFWGFLVVQATIIEIFGELFSSTYEIPFARGITFPGSSVTLLDVVGFMQDLFIALVIVAVIAFAA